MNNIGYYTDRHRSGHEDGEVVETFSFYDSATDDYCPFEVTYGLCRSLREVLNRREPVKRWLMETYGIDSPDCDTLMDWLFKA